MYGAIVELPITDNGDNGGMSEWGRIVIDNGEDEDAGAGLQEWR